MQITGIPGHDLDDEGQWHGQQRSASEVHAMSLANLDGEYCTVVRTVDLVQR